MDTNTKKEYLETKVKPILDELVFQLLCERPENPASYMIEWLKKTGGYTSNGLTLKEKEELEKLRKDIISYRKKNPPPEQNLENNSQSSESSNEDEFYDPQKEPKKKGKIGRKGISSESYGKFNKKENFKPRFIKKTDSQITRIKGRILQSFLFNNLEANDIDLVIGAMEEKNFKSGDYVIKQGDNGDCLYIVDSGELDCSKRFTSNPSRCCQS